MTRTADSIIEDVLEREGEAFTNRPADRGGPTKWGITQTTLTAYRLRHGLPPATASDVARLQRIDARLIYFEDFIALPGFLLISDGELRALCVDAGVNHGPRHAIKWLQWAAEVRQDGDLGPKTAAAVNAANPLELWLWVIAFRLRLYGRLVSRDPELVRARAAGFTKLQAFNAGGWNNRIAGFIEELAQRLEAEHKKAA